MKDKKRSSAIPAPKKIKELSDLLEDVEYQSLALDYDTQETVTEIQQSHATPEDLNNKIANEVLALARLRETEMRIIKNPVYIWLKEYNKKSEKKREDFGNLERLVMTNELVDDDIVFKFLQIPMDQYLEQRKTDGIVNLIVFGITRMNALLQREKEIQATINADTKIGVAGENLPAFIKTISEHYRGVGDDLDLFFDKIELILDYVKSSLNQQNIALSGFKAYLMPIVASMQEVQQIQDDIDAKKEELANVDEEIKNERAALASKQAETKAEDNKFLEVQKKREDAEAEIQKIEDKKVKAKEDAEKAIEEWRVMKSEIKATRLILDDLTRMKINLEKQVVIYPLKEKETKNEDIQQREPQTAESAVTPVEAVVSLKDPKTGKFVSKKTKK